VFAISLLMHAYITEWSILGGSQKKSRLSGLLNFSVVFIIILLAPTLFHVVI